MLTEKIFAVAQNGAATILWLLIVLSIFSVAIIIERYWTLRTLRRQSEQVKTRVLDALGSAQYSELEDIAKDKQTLEGQALAHAFRFAKENGSQGIEEVINGFILLQKTRLEKNLNFLATLGANAPFIGLLGTVLGIMKAFNDLGISQGVSQTNAASIMTGIGEALVATAVGLFVAIPAVIAYNSFQKQVKNILQNFDGLRELCVAYAKRKGA